MGLARHVAWLALGVALVAILQGCGGGGAATTPTPGATTNKPPTGYDTLLDNDFCKIYYRGSGDCEQLRRLVRANHSRSLPTLELGDPSKPPMLFFHGWPDTGALWANQFEYFCAPPHGKYFCVAATITNFHPDLPNAPEDELFVDIEVGKWYSVVQEMGLKDLTLVMFDWGASLGYKFTYKHPEVVKNVVALDIGNNPVTPPGSKTGAFGDAQIPWLPVYQQANIWAYRTGNFSIIEPFEWGFIATLWRNVKPKFFQTRIGWPYNCMVLNGTGQVMTERFAPGVPLSQWEFEDTPTFPSGKPLMFLYGKCDDPTGSPGFPPCEPRDTGAFFSEAFAAWVTARPHGALVAVPGAGHWMAFEQPTFVNTQIAAWLDGLSDGAGPTVMRDQIAV